MIIFLAYIIVAIWSLLCVTFAIFLLPFWFLGFLPMFIITWAIDTITYENNLRYTYDAFLFFISIPLFGVPKLNEILLKRF